MGDTLNVNNYNYLFPLRLIRIVRNQSVPDFAKSLGASREHLWSLEAGRRLPSDSFLSEKICNIDISYEDYKKFENEIKKIKKLKVDNNTKYKMGLFKALVLVYPELNRENNSIDVSKDKVNAYKIGKTFESRDNLNDNEIFSIAEKCSYEMLIRIFGTMEEESILDQIYSKKCIISSDYLFAVYNRIIKFPVDLINAKNHMPGLKFDPFYLSDALVEGYTFGIVNRIINTCVNEEIPYNFEDEILIVDNEVVAVNNELLVSVFEINKKLNQVKRRNKVK